MQQLELLNFKYFQKMSNEQMLDKMDEKAALQQHSVSRRSLLIIGIATGSGDVETWRFDDDDLCQKFCERLVRDTGRSVIVVDGTEVGRYCLADLPVVYRRNGG